jgi:hypothetical protein
MQHVPREGETEHSPKRARVMRAAGRRARNWRNPATDEHPLHVDAWDPFARLIRVRLGWDWLQFALVAWLIYGPVERLLLPALLGYLHLSGDVRTWVPDVEALLTGFVEFPFFLGFYLWTGQAIGDLFLSLERNQSLARPDRYEPFLTRVSASFDRWFWPVISFGFAVLAVLVGQFVLWGAGAKLQPWWINGGLVPRVMALALIGVVAYAVCQVVTRELLAALWLRRLWRELGGSIPHDLRFVRLSVCARSSNPTALRR